MSAQAEFKWYPKVMHHPNHAPATTRIIPNEPGTLGIFKPGSEGTPVRFPDVTVINEDEEAQYAAKGYQPVGTPDPAAYARAQAGAPPLGAEIQEYPKWKYHATKEACIVDSKAAERALGDGWFDRPDLVVNPLVAPLKSVAVETLPDRVSEKTPPAAKPKKKHKARGRSKKGWTPERRAAASAAMKARNEAKRSIKTEPPSPENG